MLPPASYLSSCNAISPNYLSMFDKYTQALKTNMIGCI